MNIAFFARVHGVKGWKQRRDELLDMVRMRPFRKRLADRDLALEVSDAALDRLGEAGELFASAGRLDWPRAWAYLGAVLVGELLRLDAEVIHGRL